MDHPLLRHEPRPFAEERPAKKTSGIRHAQPSALPTAVELASAAALLDSSQARAKVLSGLVARAFGRPPDAAGRALTRKLFALSRGVLPASTSTARRSGHKRAFEVEGARLFDLELEGFSPEDREFELARALVRLVAAAAHNVAHAPADDTPLSAAAAGLARAARKYAPGLPSRLL